MSRKHRRGKKGAAPVSMRQVLGGRKGGDYWVRIHDPETGDMLKETLVYTAEPNEYVDMHLQFYRNIGDIDIDSDEDEA